MKFRLTIQGHHFLRSTDSTAPSEHGFYVIAHVEAATAKEAERIAHDLVEARLDAPESAVTPANAQTRTSTAEITPIAAWPEGVARPLTGLVWYPEES